MCIRDRYWKREKNLKYGSGMKSEDEYYANDKKGLGGAKYKFDYIKSPLKHDKFIEFKHFLDGNVRMKALELSERRSSSGKRKRISIDTDRDFLDYALEKDSTPLIKKIIGEKLSSVSYTHLTLPTICSV
eukprot:TRINITY_DN15010_c0_g1_i2.p1 TRINITY_DN15010_c0_g1~~TRINITY_DN15010_c0_g1_i2.p1  ORF type:complete len:130 (-),score=28.99 TRINITY_DN15010_c0_g1_i2:38-427(-)